jgi:exocyst complex protein 7
VEVGFTGLMQLFLKLAREGTGKTCDPDTMIRQGKLPSPRSRSKAYQVGTPTPPNYFPPLQTLLPLTTFVAKYAAQQSYTQSIIQPILDDTMSSFASSRGEWMVKSLRGMLIRVEEVDEGGIWEGGRGKEKVAALIDLWDAMPIMAEVSTNPRDWLT